MNNVFKYMESDYEQVIIEVNADNPLTIARNPYINSNMKYITVTRGNNHLLTVVNKNGSTFSFHWGRDGYTLISNSLEMLRTKVVEFVGRDFLERRANIPLCLRR